MLLTRRLMVAYPSMPLLGQTVLDDTADTRARNSSPERTLSMMADLLSPLHPDNAGCGPSSSSLTFRMLEAGLADEGIDLHAQRALSDASSGQSVAHIVQPVAEFDDQDPTSRLS